MATKRGLTLIQMKRELRKKQDILCADTNVHVLWLSLALQMLTSGDTVRATIFSPSGEPTPKRLEGIPTRKTYDEHNKVVAKDF